MKAEEAIREFAEKMFPIKGITNATDFYKRLQNENQENFISDLTVIISEYYYPKEFVEWMIMEGHIGIHDRKGYLYSSSLLNLDGFTGDSTIENLFNYWKENER